MPFPRTACVVPLVHLDAGFVERRERGGEGDGGLSRFEGIDVRSLVMRMTVNMM